MTSRQEPTTTTTAPFDPLLSVHDVSVQFPTEDGVVRAVNNLSLAVGRGRSLGIVGESGSGKSVAAQAIVGLLKDTRARITGSVMLDGRDLLRISESEMRGLRGRTVAMIFQDPLSALHPFYTVGKQVAEAYLVHNKVGRKRARARAIEMLDRVGIANPHRRFDEYPHEFSGGMRQRAMIAMALICDPALLVADEPTTALDVTVQAQILELLREIQTEFNTAIILITHDLGLVAETCDEVLVMYGGSCVEFGTADAIFHGPQMPYTWGLLGSMPRLDRIRQSRLLPIVGSPPSLIHLPSGCVFHPRCRFRDRVGGDACTTQVPELVPSHLGGAARCHIESVERIKIWSTELTGKL